jgi:hypothetical protein
MNSPAMELEGLLRCLKCLSDDGVYVNVLVTDQHAGVTHMMKTDHSEIQHYYDGWHVVKGEPFFNGT